MAIFCLIVLIIFLLYISRNKQLYKVVDNFTNKHMWVSIIFSIMYLVFAIILIHKNHYITIVAITFFLVTTFIDIVSYDAQFIDKIQLLYSGYSAYSLAKGLFTSVSNGKIDGTIFIIVSLITIGLIEVYIISKSNNRSTDSYSKKGDKTFMKHFWLYYVILKPLLYGNEKHRYNRKIKNIKESKISNDICQKLDGNYNSNENNGSGVTSTFNSAVSKYSDSLISKATSSISSNASSSTSSSYHHLIFNIYYKRDDNK